MNFTKRKLLDKQWYKLYREKRRKYLKLWYGKNTLKCKAYRYKRRTLTKDLTLEKIQKAYQDNVDAKMKTRKRQKIE